MPNPDPMKRFHPTSVAQDAYDRRVADTKALMEMLEQREASRPEFSLLMPTAVNGIVDNDHKRAVKNGTTLPGKLDRNDVMVVSMDGIEERPTVDQFVNSDAFDAFGTPEERNKLVLDTAFDASKGYAASARRFAKSGRSFVK